MRGKILYPSILVLPGATNGMSFKDAKFMTLLPADTITKKEEETMKGSPKTTAKLIRKTYIEFSKHNPRKGGRQ